MELIQVIKALGDETRMRILCLLKDGALCVCEIEAILNINQSNTSRHLSKLSNVDILEYFKVAKYVYYRLNEDTMRKYPFVKEIIEIEAIKIKQCQYDSERLKKYRDSKLSCEDLMEGRIVF